MSETSGEVRQAVVVTGWRWATSQSCNNCTCVVRPERSMPSSTINFGCSGRNIIPLFARQRFFNGLAQEALLLLDRQRRVQSPQGESIDHCFILVEDALLECTEAINGIVA